MRSIYENKELKDKQKIKNQERKDRLFNKVKNMKKNDNDNNIEEIRNIESNDVFNQIKRLQKDKNKLKKQNLKYKNEKQMINLENRDLKRKIKQCKKQLYHINLKLHSVTNKTKLAESEANSYKEKYLKMVIQRDKSVEEKQKVQHLLTKTSKELKGKTKAVAHYQSQKQLKLNEEDSYKKQISSLSTKINSLYEEIENLKIQLKQKDQLFDRPNHMLRELMHRMSFFNLGAYWRIIPLKSKYDRLREYSKNRSHETEQLMNKIGRQKYGYVHVENNNYYFYSIEEKENRYKIIDFGTNPDLMDGSPICVELINNESAKIKTVYNFKSKQGVNENIKQSSNKNNDTNEYDDKHEFEVFNFSIGIVGSNEKYYYDFLKKMNNNVAWIDPFEKSNERSKRFIDQHDIILFFTDSIPHSFLRLIDDSPKFQMFRLNHSRRTVYNRIRFAALSLGLM